LSDRHSTFIIYVITLIGNIIVSCKMHSAILRIIKYPLGVANNQFISSKITLFFCPIIFFIFQGYSFVLFYGIVINQNYTEL
jgi:hypothetical protein